MYVNVHLEHRDKQERDREKEHNGDLEIIALYFSCLPWCEMLHYND